MLQPEPSTLDGGNGADGVQARRTVLKLTYPVLPGLVLVSALSDPANSLAAAVTSAAAAPASPQWGLTGFVLLGLLLHSCGRRK